MSAAVALATGCGGRGTPAETAAVPPDRLTLVRDQGRGGGFAVTLDCAVADRAACAEVLAALAEADTRERCVPVGGGDARIIVEGVIGGDPVRQIIGRRTDCEAEAFDRAVTALEP